MMQPQPAFGFNELFTHVIGDIAKAICERNGETHEQQVARSQATVHTIMGFLPRDVIEAMLAGHCVMFHELMLDSVRDTLRGEMDTLRRATRANIVAMDKAFGNNLARLERYQQRPSEGRRDTPERLPDTARTETGIAERAPALAARPANGTRRADAAAHEPPALAADRPAPSRAEEPDPPNSGSPIVFTPSPEAIAACRANRAAMEALEAGDAEGFARAMGIDQPSEPYLAASTGPNGVFDRHAGGYRADDPAAWPRAHRSNGVAVGGDRNAGPVRDRTSAPVPD